MEIMIKIFKDWLLDTNEKTGGQIGHLAAACKLLVAGAEEDMVTSFLEMTQAVENAIILQPVCAAALWQLIRTAKLAQSLLLLSHAFPIPGDQVRCSSTSTFTILAFLS